MYSNVVVYPNPVRETYQGSVAIKGLVANTNVKITDMGGNLVFETESLGGQAIWDGTNFQGDRVATGVYMIYLSSPDGSFSHVTKLLFIH
jgi:ribosomal protein S11